MLKKISAFVETLLKRDATYSSAQEDCELID